MAKGILQSHGVQSCRLHESWLFTYWMAFAQMTVMDVSGPKTSTGMPARSQRAC